MRLFRHIQKLHFLGDFHCMLICQLLFGVQRHLEHVLRWVHLQTQQIPLRNSINNRSNKIWRNNIQWVNMVWAKLKLGPKCTSYLKLWLFPFHELWISGGYHFGFVVLGSFSQRIKGTSGTNDLAKRPNGHLDNCCKHKECCHETLA